MSKRDRPRLEATLSVMDMPGLIADLRREMAALLLAEAGGQEDTVVGWAVARSLRAVAAAFESGLSRADAAEHRPRG
jgi:hypothetical protein